MSRYLPCAQLPKIGEETLRLHAFGCGEPKLITCNKVKLRLSNIRNGQSVDIDLLETPRVSTSIMRVAGEELRRELERKGMQLADTAVSGMEMQELGVLIGGDHYWKVVSGKLERLSGSLVALDSKFGWLIQGTVSMLNVTSETEITDIGTLHVSVGLEDQMHNTLRSFWETESIGIITERETKRCDEETMHLFEKSVQFKEGRYEVSLPWKSENNNLSSNYDVAKRRFDQLIKKFQNDVPLFDQYREVIQDYVSQGIVEPVENVVSDNPIYYLPHRAVINEEHLTTKLRVVFDASSHATGCQSLNDCLMTGPNLNPELLSILLKFRQHKVAFMADITKAFLQISIREQDRDALRFLWTDDLPKIHEKVNIRILRITRVPFGASPSPFLLAATIRNHLMKYQQLYPTVTSTLDKCLYVDDLICSAPSVQEAASLSMQAKAILKDAGMTLCKWSTNSDELKNLWKEKMENTGSGNVEVKSTVLKVLGLTWRTEQDDFIFDLRNLIDFLKNKSNTKRGVLQAAARIFDPVGFLSPFTIGVKCLFQKLWERGLEWDCELSEDLSKLWHQWCKELTDIGNIKISRCYHEALVKQSGPVQKEVHVFSDASESAYCAAAYLRVIPEDGECIVSLITAKTRVAPLKKVTLPRLELLGALIGARLSNYIITHLDMEKSQVKLWTDSMITLHWIKSSAKQWKPFVENRVCEIQILTALAQWNHCSGSENPADVATRGTSVNKLKENSLWWTGPTWLKQREINYCETELEPHENAEAVKENLSVVEVTNLTSSENSTKTELLELKNYSHLNRVLHVTAWIRRFIHNAKGKQKHTGALTAEEISEAELYWIQVTQSKSFFHEISQLKKGQEISVQSKIQPLSPFLDDKGILRVGGRLQMTNWKFEHKHPCILPVDARFSELTVKKMPPTSDAFWSTRYSLSSKREVLDNKRKTTNEKNCKCLFTLP